MSPPGNLDRGAVVDRRKENARDARTTTNLKLLFLVFAQQTKLMTRHGHRPTLRCTLRNPNSLYVT
jgi:hypothetical protein